ncbi:MAG: phosphomannomutase/phosphoglucomutase [Desulfovibrio sp.]|nr:MAG: phosphomannomutase/phosphoglucomutase [Desulfovibrio sp.]
MLDHIFRAYDIRGRVGTEINFSFARALGRACGEYFLAKGRPRAVLGRDCRLSSPELAAEVAQGLMQTGVDVISLGMVPTPVFYFAAAYLEVDAGVMVTASHNPPEYNGFKIYCQGATLHTGQIQEIAELMANAREDTVAPLSGVLGEHDIVPTYLEDMAGRAALHGPIKVVVDGGNGAGGLICVDLLRKLGAEVVAINCEPDGTFPNHHPDPVVEENMGELKARVVAEKADLGIGLDGDADRIAAFDEKGEMLYGDRLLAIYARDLLKEHPGAMVIGEVKCSHLLYRDIQAHGGEPLMWQAGHSMIKAKMRETGALLGGEVSGHVFFADRYLGFDDAAYGAARLLEIMTKNPTTPLSAMLEDWPQTFVTPEIRVFCPEEKKFLVTEKAKETFSYQYETIDVDGVRVLFNDGWALVRASNTQPALVMRFEAETRDRLEAIREMIEEPVTQWIGELSSS